jgi:hypothetical protein
LKTVFIFAVIVCYYTQFSNAAVSLNRRCMINEEFHDCASFERTCEMLERGNYQIEELRSSLSQFCVPKCQCKVGFYRKGGVHGICVSQNQCSSLQQSFRSRTESMIF